MHQPKYLTAFDIAPIQTPQLTLVCCDVPLLEVMLHGGDAALGKQLGVHVPSNWTEFGEAAFRWTYDWLKRSPFDQRWYSYLSILKGEKTLIGSCGYKGAPDATGTVEIGYEVGDHYRCRGLATEMAHALIRAALAYPDVRAVQAHTLAEENASVRILQKCGMTFVKEYEDPEDGLIWQWKIDKP